MTSFKVIPGCDRDGVEVSTRGEAEQKADTHADLCPECSREDVEIDDGIDDMEGEVEVVKTDSSGAQEIATDGNGNTEDATVPADQLPDEKPSVDEDPLAWVPGDFVDHIDGDPAINKKGYAVLAHHYNISVRTKLLVSPTETDFEYAEAHAVATTEGGERYEAHGTAHVERGDDMELLVEMADTRAAKRALSLATGVGMVAVEELKAGSIE